MSQGKRGEQKGDGGDKRQTETGRGVLQGGGPPAGIAGVDSDEGDVREGVAAARGNVCRTAALHVRLQGLDNSNGKRCNKSAACSMNEVVGFRRWPPSSMGPPRSAANVSA